MSIQRGCAGGKAGGCWWAKLEGVTESVLLTERWARMGVGHQECTGSGNLCMCVCTFMCACVCVHTHVCMCVCIFMCACVCEHVYCACVCAHSCVHVCVCMSTVHVCVCIPMCACICMEEVWAEEESRETSKIFVVLSVKAGWQCNHYHLS